MPLYRGIISYVLVTLLLLLGLRFICNSVKSYQLSSAIEKKIWDDSEQEEQEIEEIVTGDDVKWLCSKKKWVPSTFLLSEKPFLNFRLGCQTKPYIEHLTPPPDLNS